MNDDHARGRRDGLRLALAVLAAEEAKWAALLGESRSWRTNREREVRHKALQVAQKRIQTLLNRLHPKGRMRPIARSPPPLRKQVSDRRCDLASF